MRDRTPKMLDFLGFGSKGAGGAKYGPEASGCT